MSPAVAVSAILVLRPVNKRYEWCLGIVFGTMRVTRLDEQWFIPKKSP